MGRQVGIYLATVLAIAFSASSASAACSRIPPLYKSCSHVNAKWPHGVGRAGAHDHVSSGDPVTTFLRSTRIYSLGWLTGAGHAFSQATPSWSRSRPRL